MSSVLFDLFQSACPGWIWEPQEEENLCQEQKIESQADTLPKQS